MFVIIYLHFHGTSLANLRTECGQGQGGCLKNQKDAEVLSQGGNSGDDRKWLALGLVLKAEMAVFAEALHVGCERASQRRPQGFGLHSWRSRVSPMWNRDS